MGKVNPIALKDWQNGQTVLAEDYKRERDLVVTANNDTHDRILTHTNWLAPVANFAEIGTTYLTPVLGDTVQVLDTGYVYRYNGTSWTYTQGYSATAIADVNVQLADNVQQQKYFRRLAYLTQPVGFDFSIPITVYDKGYGKYEISHSILNLFPNEITKKTYYIDPLGGLDTNNGLSYDTAFKTLTKAGGMADVGTIMMKKGNYGSVEQGYYYRPNDKNIKFIAEDGTIWFQGFTGAFRTWTDLGNGTFSATATISTLYGILDSFVTSKDYNNRYSQLTKQISQVDCEANAGAYYYDDVNDILYIHTLDARQPNENILIKTLTPGINMTQVQITTNRYYYFKNIIFIDGVAFNSNSALKFNIFMENCEFKDNTTTNGFAITGNCFTYCLNCIAERNYLDGFNYHGSGIYNSEAIEINCVGRFNGIGTGNNIDNGSTLHEFCKAIRINGIYHNNEGRNVHDINDSVSWNIGCFGFDSVALLDAAKEDFASWHNAKMWLYKCSAYGTSLVNLEVEATAKMYIKACDFDTSSGTLETY